MFFYIVMAPLIIEHIKPIFFIEICEKEKGIWLIFAQSWPKYWLGNIIKKNLPPIIAEIMFKTGPSLYFVSTPLIHLVNVHEIICFECLPYQDYLQKVSFSHGMSRTISHVEVKYEFLHMFSPLHGIYET